MELIDAEETEQEEGVKEREIEEGGGGLVRAEKRLPRLIKDGGRGGGREEAATCLRGIKPVLSWINIDQRGRPPWPCSHSCPKPAPR